MNKCLYNFWLQIKNSLTGVDEPAQKFWIGAGFGSILFVILLSGYLFYNYNSGISHGILIIAGAISGFTLLLFFTALSWAFFKVVRKLPFLFFAKITGITIAFLLISLTWSARPKEGSFILLLFFLFYLFIHAVFTGSIYMLWKSSLLPKKIKITGFTLLLTTFFFIAHGFAWLMDKGDDPYPIVVRKDKTITVLKGNEVANPALAGHYSTVYFTYGSGEDIQRKEFEKVRFISPSVDGTLLLPQWKGKEKKWREYYWGFGISNIPLNARVWMPLGKGPFPLVVIVHGNHNMEDYSDEGYAYLGELLSSRGFIAASLDQNFLNGTWTGDFGGKEMPLRAWLLLKHLELWNSWNINPEHDFYEKMDMKNIILVGHSRGGEAVSIAAAFNKLKYFPDNAKQSFNFNYGIKGVVAIAPTDYRYGRKINLCNISYLSLHGSHDHEVKSFYGMRQYQRVELPDSGFHIKAGVLIYGANHFNFNDTWAQQYSGLKMLLNIKPLLTETEQKHATKVFISAFSELILNKHKEYLSLFHSASFGKEWLPESIYLKNFLDSRSSLLVDFENNLDISKSKKGIDIKTVNMEVWREEELISREGKSQENNAVVLGWDYKGKNVNGSYAQYSITIPDSIPFNSGLFHYFLISVASGNIKELSRERKKETSKQDMDFTIQLEDKSGNRKSIEIGKIKKVFPLLKTKVFKSQLLNKYLIGNSWEPRLETFVIPLDSFNGSGNFDFSSLHAIHIVFDKVDHGVVILDNIGFGENQE